MSWNAKVSTMFFIVCSVALGACNPNALSSFLPPSDPDLSKITFDLSQINDDGLTGPSDGLVAVNYEFCIPGTEEAQQEVRGIDPTVTFHPGSAGRSGCTKEQALAIGSTHQQGWKGVLARLTTLDYVNKIDRTVWE